MRLKVQTEPPLPCLKFWFLTPPSVLESAKIEDLKSLLCTSVEVLKCEDIQGPELRISLDEFELLDDCLVSILRDGDTIALRTTRVGQSVKRKAESADHTPGSKRVKLSSPKSVQRSAPRAQTSIRSFGSCDSDSSTSSTSTSALTSSPSASESEPEVDRGDKLTSNKTPHLPIKNFFFAPKPFTSLVPPGHGKPSTQSRNRRRRDKIRATKLASTIAVEPPTFPTSLVNSTPLGAPPESSDTADIYQTQIAEESGVVMMASLRNKNKKKGFKQSMSRVLPQKIVFGPDEGSPRKLPRQVPPSERQEHGELPKNIFVTKVDVEGHYDPVHDAEEGFHENNLRNPHAIPVNCSTKPTLPSEFLRMGVDVFGEAERKWPNLFPVDNLSVDLLGSVVVWQELDINPATFTPEIMLSFALIHRLLDDAFGVYPIRRPGANQVAFGRGWEEEEADDMISLGQGEEVWKVDDIHQKGWRVFSAAR